MNEGNQFPELNAEGQPEYTGDALSPDPDTSAGQTQDQAPLEEHFPEMDGDVDPGSTATNETSTSPGPAVPPTPPETPEPAVTETVTVIVPPIGPTPPLQPAPENPEKRRGNFWLWAAPIAFLLLILGFVAVRAWMMRGIATVSIDVIRPVSGQSLPVNQVTTVTARIRSSNGWQNVSFMVNNQIIETIRASADSQYDQEVQFNWTPLSEGPTMLRLRVLNKKGDQSAAEEVAVLVVNPSSSPTPIVNNEPSATVTSTPTKGPSPTPCLDLFEVVSESGLVAGTKLEAGIPFTKGWRIRNLGTCKWEGYKFVFSSGALLGASSPIPVPITEPGGTADLNLNLLSPSIIGNFVGKWRVQNDRGDIFGPELSYSLTIPSPTPTVTYTPTPSPTLWQTRTFTPPPSWTPTLTRTSTPTTPATAVFTHTATQTSTATSVDTDTPTATLTDTATIPAPTETPTVPPPTDTPTPTPTPTHWMVITVPATNEAGTPIFVTAIVTWTPTPTETPTP